MSELKTLAAPQLDLPSPRQTKWDKEYRAFLGMLPTLLPSYRGKYVAIHQGELVGSDEDKLCLAQRVYKEHSQGNRI